MNNKRPYIHEDFLLDGPAAQQLYHEFAEPEPIIDYHNHLLLSEIVDDRQYDDLAEIWLGGDHYKWRAMRANGISERLISGQSTPWEKFQAWASTVPATLGNPLYQWTHMELARPFGITDCLLNEATAKAVWDRANERLRLPEFSCRGLLKKWNVKLLCTTDDPADDLSIHARIAADPTFDIVVYPTFRPDRALAIEEPMGFRSYVDKLGVAADIVIRNYADFLEALRSRHDAFHAHGCRLSDHAIAEPFVEDYTEADVVGVFRQVCDGKAVDAIGARKFRSALLVEFGRWAHEKGWAQQYHIGALRNVSSRLFNSLGPDAGGDTIGDKPIAEGLARMLDRLDTEEKLPRTILYNLNPSDTEVVAAMTGCFQCALETGDSCAGKIQLGSAWWFNDQENGIVRQLTALSNFGLLSKFIGMTTDSRSFLSFSRHDYFRRILCTFLGGQIDRGRLPDDINFVGGMVRDICYDNVRHYLGFDEIDHLPRIKEAGEKN